MRARLNQYARAADGSRPTGHVSLVPVHVRIRKSILRYSRIRTSSPTGRGALASPDKPTPWRPGTKSWKKRFPLSDYHYLLSLLDRELSRCARPPGTGRAVSKSSIAPISARNTSSDPRLPKAPLLSVDRPHRQRQNRHRHAGDRRQLFSATEVLPEIDLRQKKRRFWPTSLSGKPSKRSIRTWP